MLSTLPCEIIVHVASFCTNDYSYISLREVNKYICYVLPKKTKYSLKSVLKEVCTIGNMSDIESIREISGLGKYIGKYVARWSSSSVAIEYFNSHPDEVDIDHIIYNMDLLERYHVINKFDHKTMCIAARKGNLDILKFIGDSVPPSRCPRGEDIAQAAAAHGNLNCVKFLNEAGYEMGDWTIERAIQNDHLNIIEYMESTDRNPTKLHVITAAVNGKLDILVYLIEVIGLDCDEEVYENARGFIDCILYLESKNCPQNEITDLHPEIEHGSLECVKHMLNKGVQWDKHDIKSCIWYNRCKILEYLFSIGSSKYLVDDGLCRLAIHCGSLDVLRVLVEQGYNVSMDGVEIYSDYDESKNVIMGGCSRCDTNEGMEKRWLISDKIRNKGRRACIEYLSN